MLEDRTIGCIVVTFSSIFTLYYMIWIAAMPFVDSEHYSQAWFPPKKYGLVIPAIMGGTLLTVTIVIGSLHAVLHYENVERGTTTRW